MKAIKARFSKVFLRAQLEAGINLVGAAYVLAIMSDNLGYNSQGDLLLNLSVGMAEDAEAAKVIASLPRMTKAELDASGMTELYNEASITISVRGAIQTAIERAHEDGQRSIPLEIVDLKLVGNRVDQSTGSAIEGKYLFNFRPGGIKISVVDFGVEATKAAVENTVAVANNPQLPAPKRDWGAIAAKVTAMQATASIPAAAPNAPATTGVSVFPIMAIAKKHGITWSPAQAKAIASTLDQAGLDYLNQATSAAEVTDALALAGVTV